MLLYKLTIDDWCILNTSKTKQKSFMQILLSIAITGPLYDKTKQNKNHFSYKEVCIGCLLEALLLTQNLETTKTQPIYLSLDAIECLRLGS